MIIYSNRLIFDDFSYTVHCLIIRYNVCLAISDDSRSESGSSIVDLYDLPASKRPYFISPRVGRSFWDEPSRREPLKQLGPMILLLTNPDGQIHQINARSSTKLGYVPQARVGRRAQPTGLMPMPRVGRSDPSLRNLIDDDATSIESPTTATLLD